LTGHPSGAGEAFRPPLLPCSSSRDRAWLPSSRKQTPWKRGRTGRCGLPSLVHARSSGSSSLSCCRNLWSFVIICCYKIEHISVVVGANILVVILCLTGESGLESGPDMSVNKQPRSGRGNFLKKSGFTGRFRVSGRAGAACRRRGFLKTACATSVAWQSLSLRENCDCYERNIAILEPTGTPTSSAIGWHLTHIRYATGGRASYPLSDS
jgi:hypothetical protein